MRRTVLLLVTLTLTTLGVGGAALVTDDSYQVSVLLPNATNLNEGGSVMSEGYEAGAIEEIAVESGKAKVTLSLQDDFAPLHEGAQVQMTWKAVLGERLLTVTDGPPDNLTVPAGGMLAGKPVAPVEIDQVLATLDPRTRGHLSSLVRRLSDTLHGRETDVRATLATAGPAVRQLGTMLRDVEADGVAIRSLVRRLNDTMVILARRDRTVQQVVQHLGRTTRAAVRQRQALGRSVRVMPATIRQATGTLRRVPAAAEATMPLLRRLQPATTQLPEAAAKLRPLLADLRPSVAQLRPTLAAAESLLRHTPSLLDTSHATVPEATRATRKASPALDFLRPYTPELVGWLSNWASAAANYDANGHYGRIYVQTGGEAGNVNPGVTTPGVRKDPTPLPGELVNQPWTDAHGDGMQ